MGTHGLPARLERDDVAPTIATFPDGSVDTFYRVAAGGTAIDTRGAFADAVSPGSSGVVSLRRDAVEPGGHAVNVGEQAVALGEDVRVAGHLDHPVFADLPFEAVSMGEPASVAVYGFDDGDVLAVENTADLAGWTFADLVAAVDDLESFLTRDVVCCVNWTSVPGVLDALSSIAGLDVDGGWLLVDPGAIGGRSSADVDRLFDALERLTATYQVVLAANPREIDRLGEMVGVPSDDTLEGLRDRSGLEAVVVHGASRAAAATPTGRSTHENYDVEVTRHTGGGDRFDAGLAHAIAREWSWEDALRLGNACASRYVATGRSGTASDLAAFLRERD